MIYNVWMLIVPVYLAGALAIALASAWFASGEDFEADYGDDWAIALAYLLGLMAFWPLVLLVAAAQAFAERHEA